MAHWRLSMRHIDEILRLHHDVGLSSRQIAQSIGVSATAVKTVVKRAREAGLTWPLPAGMNQDALERLLYPRTIGPLQRPEPDWRWVHTQLRHKGVTLQLLWEEYRETSPDGYGYSAFCEHYRHFAKTTDRVMRHVHRAGEELFLDYAGETVPVSDPRTGDVRPVQIFVAVLGASNYTYAEATWSQSAQDWIGSHVRAFAFFGGVTEALIPDNLKGAVIKSNRYEPALHSAYLEMARHYGVVVLPARVRKPRDKAKVEVGVQVVERWILARLRHRTFFSLEELNAAIRELLVRLNDRPFQKLEGSRRSLYEELDRPALRALPAIPYEFAVWKHMHVHNDYHVEVDLNFYSVPYALVNLAVDVRVTQSTVEIFRRGERVTSHARAGGKGHYRTLDEHMPPEHLAYARRSAERYVERARSIGPETARMIQAILDSRARPQLGFRTCDGILSLGRDYPAERVEAACHRALGYGGLSYTRVRTILERGLDRLPQPRVGTQLRVVHENLRGPQYFGSATGEATTW